MQLTYTHTETCLYTLRKVEIMAKSQNWQKIMTFINDIKSWNDAKSKKKMT